MKKFTLKFICLFLFICWGVLVNAADKTVESVTIMQVDTFAFEGECDQLVLKINIRVAGTTNSINLTRFVVNTANEDNADVDSVGLYYTGSIGRFSKFDNAVEYFPIGKKQAIVGDSVAFSFPSKSLETGDNFFWVAMDLNKYSKAAHFLDAFIKKEGITIGANSYPSVESKPTGVVGIVDIYYRDNFERLTMSKEPVGWTQEQLNGSPARWLCNIGGYSSSGPGNPSKAKSGTYNVLLARQSYTPYKTILVSPKLDLSLATRAMLCFYHAMVMWERGGVKYLDELRVLYKIGSSGSWQELRKYELEAEKFTKREILLPEGISYSDIYLGFEGTTNYGWGVCIDSLIVYETGVVPREIKEIIANQPSLDQVPQGSTNNPVLKVNFRVKGTTGPIILNSFTVTSANTSDADVKPSGIQLFATNEDAFISPKQCGTAQSFAGGVATFSGLDKALETGNNYFWITYDVNTTAYPGNKLDAKININDIMMSTGNYPTEVLDPDGERKIQQTFFFEDFDLPSLWQLNGEFQIGTPMGKGGLTRGRPDPTYAFSGTTVLGTDLSGMGSLLGDYEGNIQESNPYTAISPTIDASYFKNLSLQYYRYLNIDNTDIGAVEYKLDGTSDWVPLWTSATKFIEMEWSKQAFFNLSQLKRKKFQLRFRLGPTDAIDNYSGWNVDYLFMTGDSIPFDASVDKFISPQSSCSLTSNERVKVRITNSGPRTLVNFPILLSLDGGKTYIQENVGTPIPKNEYYDYEFTTPIDLSNPKIYNIIVKAAHPGDNYPENDSIVQSVISFPTYNLPYIADFEPDTTFWFSYGINNSWFEDMPGSGIIKEKGKGTKYWKTHNSSGYHNLNEKSYVQSPCLSFTGSERPMIDMDLNYITKPQMDGVVLEYTLDQGNTWKYVKQNTAPYLWTWYTDTVKTLELRGWSGATLNNEWIEGRQFLPTDVNGNGKVQFRFTFKSDVTTLGPEEGFAFDNLKIYDAPHDIGVDTIKGISNPACQYQNSPYLNVDIKNYGVRNMKMNDTIIVGAMVNGIVQAIDTFKLASDLAIGASRNFTFTKPVNFVDTGSYTIKAYTINGAESSFYGTDNDTATIKFKVRPNPTTGLPAVIPTAEPDSVILKLVENVDYEYKWHNDSIRSTLRCTKPGYYKVTVTNVITGCKTKDSTLIKGLISDVKLDAILTPTNHCGYDGGDAVKAIIRIKNTGTDTLRINRAIPVNYILDGGTVVKDTVKLIRRLKPDSTVVLQLREVMDLSDNRLYSLKMYTALSTDTVKTNDSDSIGFTIYGYPTLELGDPTIVKKDTMYTFTAPAGYSTYKWSNDSVTNTNTVKTSGWYKLTVQDNHGCPAKDSAYVFLKVRDLKPQRLVSPTTTCKNDTLSDVIFRIKNNGTDTIRTSDTIFISYQLNAKAIVADTLNPISEILPGDSIDFKFNGQEDLKSVDTYSFKMAVRSAPESDYIKKNDTTIYIVKVHGLPNPDIGVDASIQALNYLLDPGTGFVSYLWQDGSTDSTYLITQNHMSADQRYQVTVTDVFGCQNSTPKIFKILRVPDVAITEIVLPTTACSLTNKEAITVKVKNTGNAPVNSDKIIRLKYQVNGGAFSRIDTLILASNFNQNQVLTHTFMQLADLSSAGTKAVKVFVEYPTDVRIDNDTLTNFVKVFNRPDVRLSPNDTIIADLPYTLDAGSGFISYVWNTGATTQTIDVSVTGTYTVTVTNESYCDASSSAYVAEKTFDLGVTSVDLPGEACFLTSDETVTVNVKNTGTETLTDMPITLGYVLNGVTQISENFLFTGKSGASQNFSFAEKVDLSDVNTHTLVLSLTYANDETVDNNELTKNILTTGSPSFVFSNEVNDTIRTNIFPYVLDAGAFTSYRWQDNTDNRVFSAPGEGWYKVTVINASSCIGSDSVFIMQSTAIRNIEDKVKISIFPNPSKDNVYIDMFLEAPETIIYQIFSSSGSIITDKKLSGSLQYNEVVDGLKLAKGVYYIRVSGKDWLITEKIIIQ